eukprot:363333-Chlamydomonas_euryale.AAC.8
MQHQPLPTRARYPSDTTASFAAGSTPVSRPVRMLCSVLAYSARSHSRSGGLPNVHTQSPTDGRLAMDAVQRVGVLSARTWFTLRPHKHYRRHDGKDPRVLGLTRRCAAKLACSVGWHVGGTSRITDVGILAGSAPL